jgi:hypothetical protein
LCFFYNQINNLSLWLSKSRPGRFVNPKLHFSPVSATGIIKPNTKQNVSNKIPARLIVPGPKPGSRTSIHPVLDKVALVAQRANEETRETVFASRLK